LYRGSCRFYITHSHYNYLKMPGFTTLAWLALTASPATAFWRLPCVSPIVVERLDPIVNPDAVSTHVHTIMGGNGFAKVMDYNTTQSSTCSSCTVIGDNSNYWIPNLWYQGSDGKFTSVNQVGGATVYYLQRGGDGEKLKAFPPGFRMLAGDTAKRTAGTDFASQAISYNCLGTSNPETNAFPNYNCPSGLRAQVFFPSCWDGQNLDSGDHKSHMSYPVGAYNNGKCPSTHPVHLISIFYEVVFDTNKFASQWSGGKQPFVWSNGDNTGYGLHGDFIMGWEEAHLQSAVDDCTNLSGRVEDCQHFQLIPNSQAQGCTVQPVVDEVVSGTLDKLPGGEAVINDNVGPDFTDLTSDGWSYVGCGQDNYYSRILTGASTSQSSMTNDQCVKFCDGKGFSIAGTEYSKECYCGNSIPDVGAPIAGLPGNCKMPCAGDATQMCGGSGPITLYKKCSGTTCVNAIKTPSQVTVPSTGGSSGGSSPSGGSAPSSSSAAASQPSQGSPSTGTPSTGSPSSGNPASGSPASGSSPSGNPSSGSPSTGNPSSGNPPADSDDSDDDSDDSPPSSPPPSSSSPTKAPSSGSPATTSSAAAATIHPSANPNLASPLPSNNTAPTGWAYAGCYVDSVFPRSLPVWSNFNGPKMTNGACMAFCEAKGQPYAGTEYAGQCFCGEGLTGSESADEEECSTTCTGASGEKCGGPGVLSLWVKSTSSKRSVRRHLNAHAHKRTI
jgi:hypothetical protein